MRDKNTFVPDMFKDYVPTQEDLKNDQQVKEWKERRNQEMLQNFQRANKTVVPFIKLRK